MKIQLERTSYYQDWAEPTLSDLLAIEREKRNAYISAELAEMDERNYHNDYDYELDNA